MDSRVLKLGCTSEPCAVAAAKSLQSCPTLCDPIDGSPPGFPVPGILQARTLEWVAIFLSNAWKWKVKVKLLSHVWLFATPWTSAYPGSSVHGIFQARVLEWGAIVFSQNHVRCIKKKKKNYRWCTRPTADWINQQWLVGLWAWDLSQPGWPTLMQFWWHGKKEALFRPLYMEQFLKGKRNSQWGSVMVNYGSTWLDHGVFRYLVKHSSVSRGYFWMKLTPEGWVKQIALPSGGGPHPNPLKAQTAWQAAVRGVGKRWVQLSMRTYTESKAE